MSTNYVDDRKHDIRCEKAKSKTCHCGCKGKYHGLKSGVKADWTPSKNNKKIHSDGRSNDPSILYEGVRRWHKNQYGGDERDWSVLVNGKDLDLRSDLINHSREFNWGYSGSGPAQLALAILADYKGDEFALRYYQDFKTSVISNWQYNEWKLTGREINEWIHKRQVEQKQE